MSDPIECAICGTRTGEIRDGIAHWRPPIAPAWDVVPRCADRTACAERVKAAGEPWPLVETDRAEPVNATGTARPNKDALNRRREYAEWAARQPPSMLDRRAPKVDPITGAVRFAPPVPIDPIPVIEPAPLAPHRQPPDDPEEWW